MRRRDVISLGFIVALAAGNALYWTGRHRRAEGHESRVAVGVQALRIRGLNLGFQVSAMRRDLFMTVRPAPARVPMRARVVHRTPVALTPSPAQLQKQAVQVALAQLKCVGVVFRHQEREAFFVNGKHMYLARVGGLVEGRFLVGAIRATSVSLSDPETGLSSRLPVSGK